MGSRRWAMGASRRPADSSQGDSVTAPKAYRPEPTACVMLLPIPPLFEGFPLCAQHLGRLTSGTRTFWNDRA